MKSPDPKSDDGSVGVFFIVALLGIIQIGAIVCSLSLLAKGIETEVVPAQHDYFSRHHSERCNGIEQGESTPLMPSHLRHINSNSSRAALKGSIAGIYSLAGGAGILLLTKLGGLMFDKVDVGSPFFMMEIFNAVLFVLTLICDVVQAWSSKAQQTVGLEGVEEQDEEQRYRDDG
jgi:hypothetical protein